MLAVNYDGAAFTALSAAAPRVLWVNARRLHVRSTRMPLALAASTYNRFEALGDMHLQFVMPSAGFVLATDCTPSADAALAYWKLHQELAMSTSPAWKLNTWN